MDSLGKSGHGKDVLGKDVLGKDVLGNDDLDNDDHNNGVLLHSKDSYCRRRRLLHHHHLHRHSNFDVHTGQVNDMDHSAFYVHREAHDVLHSGKDHMVDTHHHHCNSLQTSPHQNHYDMHVYQVYIH